MAKMLLLSTDMGQGPEVLRMMVIPAFLQMGDCVVQRGPRLGWTLSPAAQVAGHVPFQEHSCVSQHQEELASKGPGVSYPITPSSEPRKLKPAVNGSCCA